MDCAGQGGPYSRSEVATIASLARAVAPEAALRGYTKNGAIFTREKDGLIQQAWIQGRTDGGVKCYTFTLDAAISSLTEALPASKPMAHPHWHKRVGFLLPESKDIWWPMRTLVECADELRTVFAEYVFPEFDRLTPLGIVGSWLRDEGTGISLAWEKRALEEARRVGLIPIE